MNNLFFGKGNAKLDKSIATFSLPSGFTCPSALDCLSKADRTSGKITDGAKTVFRCFSASQEGILPSVRKARWDNFEALKPFNADYSAMANFIEKNLPKENIVRVHVSGDFFSQTYFDAWLEVAKRNPSKVFYAYTKSLPFWIKRKNDIPSNFKLTASKGGRNDNLIEKHNLKFAEVVYSEAEALEKNLEIDKDDSHAFAQDNSFALLIHGVQPANSNASKAAQAIKITKNKP